MISWKELVDAGGYAGARDRGTLRLEGRDYVMDDGDVITVKFTPLEASLRRRSARRRMPSALAASAPARWSVGVSGGRLTFTSWRVAISLKASSWASLSSRAPRVRGRSSAPAPPGERASFSSCSRVSWARSSSAAVLAPIPGAPGMPSEGSPRRAMKSGNLARLDAVALAHLRLPDAPEAAAAAKQFEHLGPVGDRAEQVPVGGQHQRLAAPGHLRAGVGEEQVVGLEIVRVRVHEAEALEQLGRPLPLCGQLRGHRVAVGVVGGIEGDAVGGLLGSHAGDDRPHAALGARAAPRRRAAR